MTEDKTLIKKELILILKLDSKLNYKDIEEVKKVHTAAVNKKGISTGFGSAGSGSAGSLFLFHKMSRMLFVSIASLEKVVSVISYKKHMVFICHIE